MLNQVIVTGKLASKPKKVITQDGTALHVFTIASAGPSGRFVFPPVVADQLPEFVAFNDDVKLPDQVTLTVIGWVRTVNVSTPLKDEVLRLARKAKVSSKIMARLSAVLDKANGALAKRVVVEIFAEQILPGGDWL